MRFQWLVSLVLVIALGVVAATYFTRGGKDAKTEAEDAAEAVAKDSASKKAVIDDILKEPTLKDDSKGVTKPRRPDRPVVAQTVTPPSLPVRERWHNQTLPRGNTDTKPAAKTFETETRDEDWAQATEERLKKRVTEMATGGISLENVECRSSMCRLKVDGSADMVVGFIDKMIDDSAARADVGSVTLGGDSSDAAMFLTYKR